MEEEEEEEVTQSGQTSEATLEVDGGRGRGRHGEGSWEYPDKNVKTREADQKQEKLFRHMANLAAHADWNKNDWRVGDLLDFEVKTHNMNCLNTKPVDNVT
eukprot:3842239-Ditylum_brightwellii.AAC.1